MATTTHQTLQIGELSRRTGVPVKTIRFYSDQGVLPPAEVTDAGYRRYAEPDVVRLETIRTLRAAGFDIATIREVLERNLDPDDAVRIQIEAIAVQERTLRRQRLILERALERNDVPGHPERGRALALLSTAERSAFLRNRLELGVEDVPVDEDWWTSFLSAAVDDIPDDLEDDQLTAWIELVEMIEDPSFAETIRRTAAPFWSEFVASGRISLGEWQAQQAAFVERVRQALRDGIDPVSETARGIVQQWVDDLAGIQGDESQVRKVLGHMVTTHDPRHAQYWKLIATIKRMPYDQELQDAWEWIMAAIDVFLENAKHDPQS